MNKEQLEEKFRSLLRDFIEWHSAGEAGQALEDWFLEHFGELRKKTQMKVIKKM
jgi:hypothetical protein